MEYLKIAILPLAEAKRLQAKLAKDNVELRLDHNESTCTRGCSVTVELWAKEQDLSTVKKAFNEDFAKLLEGHQVDWNQLNEVFDPSRKSAVCPACGHQFSTELSSCPDCGLNLGV